MSMSIYDKIFPPRLLTLPNGKQVSKPRSRAPLAAVILVAHDDTFGGGHRF